MKRPIVLWLLVIAASTAACSDSNPTSAPSAVLSSQQIAAAGVTECSTIPRITSVEINTNMASPRMIVDVTFDAASPAFEAEVQRLKGTVWVPWGSANTAKGDTRFSIEVWFNFTYRVRFRIGDCPWTEWIQKVVGPPNTVTPPPTPPPGPVVVIPEPEPEPKGEQEPDPEGKTKPQYKYVSYWQIRNEHNDEDFREIRDSKRATCEGHEGAWLGDYDVPGDDSNHKKDDVCRVLSLTTNVEKVRPGRNSTLFTPPGFIPIS